MKKLILGVATAAILTTGALAKTERKNYVGIKTGSLSHDTIAIAKNDDPLRLGEATEDKFGMTGLTFATTHVKESGFLWGMASDIYSVYDGFGVGINIKLGFAPEALDKKLDIYVLGGYDLGIMSDYQAYQGSSTGLGVNYDLTDDFSVTAEYKSMSLTSRIELNSGREIEGDFEPKGLTLAVNFKY
jgi:opacity protein-like surface antigen